MNKQILKRGAIILAIVVTSITTIGSKPVILQNEAIDEFIKSLENLTIEVERFQSLRGR